MTKGEAIEELKLFKESAIPWDVPILLTAIDMAIEALQTPPISQRSMYQAGYRQAQEDRPRGEWISVSEKPKDEKKTYLVQLDGGGMCSCRWTNTNPFWTDLTTEWHWCIFDIPQYSKVVAWMDLEPYKGGEGE